MKFAKEKILVTGGTGFLGSGVVTRLAERGYYVVVLDNESRGSKSRLGHLGDRYKMIQGDVCDKQVVREAAKGVSTIFHLAFINGTEYFYSKPEEVLRVALKGALQTVEVAKEYGIEKYILASSSEVYQSPTTVPTAEDERLIIPDIWNPRFSYSGGKIASELLVANYFRSGTSGSTIFRPHNIFGPNMGFEHVVPELIHKLFVSSNRFTESECILDIQGTGQETRAFCYIEVALDQIMFIYDHGLNGEIYNIGVERETTISRLISDIGKILGIRINIRPGPRRAGGTMRRCPSMTKLKELGYQEVETSSYLLGLSNTVNWYKQYFLDEHEKIKN